MSIYRKTDHAEEAPTLLLDQYKDKPRLKALLLSYIRRVQELEDAIWDVLTKRLIDNAEGAQLDVLGRIVGQRREGREDDVYRLYIGARIRINSSKGRADDILDVLALVESVPTSYTELYPASIAIEFLDATEAPPTVLIDLARQAKPSGVRIGIVVPNAPVDQTFAFSDAVSGDNDPARGFGHEGSTEYGGLISSYYGD